MLYEKHAKRPIWVPSVTLGWYRAIKAQMNNIIKPHSFIDTSPDDSRGHLMTN